MSAADQTNTLSTLLVDNTYQNLTTQMNSLDLTTHVDNSNTHIIYSENSTMQVGNTSLTTLKDMIPTSQTTDVSTNVHESTTVFDKVSEEVNTIYSLTVSATTEELTTNPPVQFGNNDDKNNSINLDDLIMTNSDNESVNEAYSNTTVLQIPPFTSRNISISSIRRVSTLTSNDTTSFYNETDNYSINNNNDTFNNLTDGLSSIISSSSSSSSSVLSSFSTPNHTTPMLGFDVWKDGLNFTTNRSDQFEDNNYSLSLPPQLLSPDHFMHGDTQIDTTPETIAKVSVLAIITIFGSIGNFLVVGSIIKNRHLHRPPFYFLLSMAVTDMARAGFCLPVVMATTLQGSVWRHGPSGCKMFAFAASFFVFSSTLSLLSIAVERHISIVYSKAYRRRCQGYVNLCASIFIWAVAFCISFPPVFSVGGGGYIFISEEAQCTYNHQHFSHNDGLNSVLIFIGITSLTFFLYYRIFIFMRLHRRMRPLQHRPAFSSTWTFFGPGANGQAFINWLNGFGRDANAPATRQTTTSSSSSSGSGQRSVQRLNFGRVVNLCTTRNQHLTRLFFIMTLVHGITWLPYVILSLWRVFLNSSNIPGSFMTYAAWLSYSQVAFCPLAYFVSRGAGKNSSRIIQMESCERNEFLLENKIGK